MVRLASPKNRIAPSQSSQPLSRPEKPRLFPIDSANGDGREYKSSRLDEFQPRWWGNVQPQVK
jgi:hypothetical protein